VRPDAKKEAAMRVQDKVAIVTASGGPMGGAIAERLAEEGARVVLNDRIAGRLQEWETKLVARGFETLAVLGNPTKRADAEALVEQTVARFGPVDILVNVIGGLRGTLSQPLLDQSEEQWEFALGLNLRANFHLVQLCAPAMIERRSGRIINIASVDMGGAAGRTPYATAKAAVAGFTKSLAAELGPHSITVNAIAPGLIRTSVMQLQTEEGVREWIERSLLKRIGEPVDVANAALFLASEEARHITAQILYVSGGITPGIV
jgi:NAD(P)-dependent dehydrogenase (short-subunit alcohol dehydrogenase family)